MTEGGKKINGARLVILINVSDESSADKSIKEIKSIITGNKMKIAKDIKYDAGTNYKLFITVKGKSSKEIDDLVKLLEDKYEITDRISLAL